MEIPPKLKEYIDNNRSVFTDNNHGSLPAITDLDEPPQIDSLGLIRLVAFLDDEFGYRIEDEEMTADNFATLRQLGKLLATKTTFEYIYRPGVKFAGVMAQDVEKVFPWDVIASPSGIKMVAPRFAPQELGG